MAPRRLINAHTAGILPRAHFDFEARIYPSGSIDRQGVTGCGLLFGISVGITERLNVGISYGGDGIVGRGRIRGNPYPGALIKYRIIEESFVMPAIAIGYDHQGFGGVNDDWNGIATTSAFVYKSQGFFMALSKSYLLGGKLQLGIHGAVNFSLEEIRETQWPNGYLGLDFGINEELFLVVEYDLALNSNKDHNPFHGYFNTGIRWALAETFSIEFDVKDMFRQKKVVEGGEKSPFGVSRELRLVYVTGF